MSLVLPVLYYSGIWTEGPLLRSVSKAATIETECTVFRPTVLYLMCNLCDPAHTELTQLSSTNTAHRSCPEIQYLFLSFT